MSNWLFCEGEYLLLYTTSITSITTCITSNADVKADLSWSPSIELDEDDAQSHGHDHGHGHDNQSHDHSYQMGSYILRW